MPQLYEGLEDSAFLSTTYYPVNPHIDSHIYYSLFWDDCIYLWRVAKRVWTRVLVHLKLSAQLLLFNQPHRYMGFLPNWNQNISGWCLSQNSFCREINHLYTVPCRPVAANAFPPKKEKIKVFSPLWFTHVNIMKLSHFCNSKIYRKIKVLAYNALYFKGSKHQVMDLKHYF